MRLVLDIGSFRGCQYYLSSGRTCRSSAQKGQCLCSTHRRKLKQRLSRVSLKRLSRLVFQACHMTDNRHSITEIYLILCSRKLLPSHPTLAKVTLQKAIDFKRAGFINPHAIIRHYYGSTFGCVHVTREDRNRCGQCQRKIAAVKNTMKTYTAMPMDVISLCVDYVVPFIANFVTHCK